MLKRVNQTRKVNTPAVTVREAVFPALFLPGLEFNAPVHGTWNIVHMGMLVPEARQIYVCASNCMRGVVLTAAEMNLADRFSFVILEENDLMEGTVEDITIEGVTDVLRRLPALPPAVLLFTVCVHHFLGCDLNRIYRELEKRFPEVTFVRCFMDPIMQKNGCTPDQKLRKSMCDLLPECEPVAKTVTLLGNDFALEDTADIRRLLTRNGYTLRETPACKTYKEYLNLSQGEVFLSVYPPAQYGVRQAAERLGRRTLYLPMSFDYGEIALSLHALCDALGLPDPILSHEVQACETALSQALQTIGSVPIYIDYTVHPRPLGLACLILSHGFNVQGVYLDSVSGEERAALDWLKENAPDLLLMPTIQPLMRVVPRESAEKILAIGQKAAWFKGTPYFVNLVQGGGLWGFDGIRRMAARMEEAFLTEKDTEDIVPRKGLGCESCI